MKNLLIIGFGNMGSAIFHAVKDSFNTTIIDPLHQNHNNFKIYKDIPSIPTSFKPDIILFCIKPQQAKEVISIYSKYDSPNLIIISILAGTKIEYFRKNFKEASIIRSMPNLGAIARSSISFLYTDRILTNQKTILVESLFNMIGKFIWLKNEDLFHQATAVAGSGPAYFFLILDIFTKYLNANGFSLEDSQLISLATAESAINTVNISQNYNYTELKNNVTSKGGTTEAALSKLYSNNFIEIFKNALDEAKKRSIELSDTTIHL